MQRQTWYTLFSKRSAHENHANFLRSLGHRPRPRVILIWPHFLKMRVTGRTGWNQCALLFMLLEKSVLCNDRFVNLRERVAPRIVQHINVKSLPSTMSTRNLSFFKKKFSVLSCVGCRRSKSLETLLPWQMTMCITYLALLPIKYRILFKNKNR